MKNVKLMSSFLVLMMVVATADIVFAEGSKTDKLLELLKSKGVISDGDVAGVKEGVSLDGITIGGTVEGAFQYVTDRDRADPNTDSTSELYLATMEIAVEAELNDNATARIILLAEDIGLAGSSDNPAVDEAIITISNLLSTPIYLVGGKRALPFGQFFTHTISDPVANGAYEVNKASFTVGAAVAKGAGLDVSLTVYKGEDMMTQVADMAATFTRDQADETDDMNSFIFSATIAPVEGLSAGLAYASEPGYDARNNTANVFAEYTFKNMTFDAEYFAATKRETIGGVEYKDSALAIGFAYQVNDPLELAVRYETFDNDRSVQAQGDIDYNLALGANYGLMENIDLLFEIRCLNEDSAGDPAYEERVHEVNLMLSAGF